MANYYELLGVSLDASPDAIRKAYRTKAKGAHPDLKADGHAAAMVALNKAYETLRDPARRKAYNASLAPSRKLPRRPAAAPARGIDPLEFYSRIFVPLDRELSEAIERLLYAIEELAYDLYDDTYVMAFDVAVERTKGALGLAERRLDVADWPLPWEGALNLYSQGMRQAEDALEDFRLFVNNYDADLIVQGRTILRGGAELMAEARGRFRVG